jgi:molybdopterin-containing oxidoreductase family membrane subunit
MDIKKRKQELVKEFLPKVVHPTKWSNIWVIILSMIILVGLYAFIVQVRKGHIVTGMRDNVVWGIYIINFIFFVCLSYSGAFFAGILHFYKTPWKNSALRIVEIVTVLSLIVGPIFILLCIGRLDRLHYLFLYPRIQSPITWDIIAIMTDLVGCLIYLYISFIPDFAILRDNSENISKWRQKLYRKLAFGYHDTKSQRKRLKKVTRTMSAMIIAMAIVTYSVLAWIFSLTVQPGWNSSIFAPYFIVAGLYSGIGVVIIAMYLIRKYFHLEEHIRLNHFKGAGIILLVISLLFGYFTFSEYFSRWFSHKTHDINLLNTLFNKYFWMFIFANYIGVLVPIIIVFIKKFRTIKAITFAAVIAVLGLWFNRYLIIVPTLETPYLPIQDTRPEFISYSATWVEWALSFAGLAAFVLFFILLMRLVPIIPMSGIIEHERYMERRSKKRT